MHGATWLERRFAALWVRLCALVLIALVIALLTSLSFQRLPDVLDEGAVATRDIKADRNYEIIDEDASHTAREDAMASVANVYDFDEGKGDEQAAHVKKAFTDARAELTSFTGAVGLKRGIGALKKDVTREGLLRSAFEGTLGMKLSDDDWDTFLNDGFSDKAELAITGLVRKEMAHPIVAERATLMSDKERGITVRRIGRVNGEMVLGDEWTLIDVASIATIDEAKARLDSTRARPEAFRGAVLPRAVQSVAKAFIIPNLFLDNAETEMRRTQAARNVKPSIIKIKAGEIIIRDGSRYEKSHLKLLRGIEREKESGAFSHAFFGSWLLALIILVVPIGLARRFLARFRPTISDYLLMGTVTLAVLAMIRVFLALFPAIREEFFTQTPPSAFSYLIPVAGGAMLIRMVLNVETTLIFAVVLSMICALFMQTDILFTTFVLLSSFTAMLAIANADRRSLIFRAGLVTGLVNVAIVLGIRLVGMVSVAEVISPAGVFWSALFGFLGGIGCSIFVMLTAPLIESFMNYTTDIKLLEMANLNHPLLRELIVSAPGTYHHSHLVGVLGEAAAEAIGANALLVRVGAYYHDIGKMKKPLYFIENVRNGDNKHEKLTPNMSALIIQAHVKDGIDMAESARLPKAIVDMIPQHHGTRMISYFYDKAKQQVNPDLQKVDPKEFEYGGPKPQTREAAILMLADVVEAQTRTIKEKSPARIEQAVRKIIDDVFRESQLDECELTLKDLDFIHKAFVRILLGIYHQRIEYPEKEKGDKSGETVVQGSEGGGSGVQEAKTGAKSSGKTKKH